MSINPIHHDSVGGRGQGKSIASVARARKVRQVSNAVATGREKLDRYPTQLQHGKMRSSTYFFLVNSRHASYLYATKIIPNMLHHLFKNLESRLFCTVRIINHVTLLNLWLLLTLSGPSYPSDLSIRRV